MAAWYGSIRFTNRSNFGALALGAFLHGFNGASILEVPHRFIAGLFFGWLRHRSGSRAPSSLAHATLNSLAVLV